MDQTIALNLIKCTTNDHKKNKTPFADMKFNKVIREKFDCAHVKKII
jgi:hypothetical protein